MREASHCVTIQVALALTTGLLASPIAYTADREGRQAGLEASILTLFSVNEHLRDDPIEVHARDGEVRLTGTVSNGTERALAAEIARGAEGVRSVRNELVVADDGGSRRGLGARAADAAITARVKARLLWNSHTDGLDIAVTTQNRHVVLTGTVNQDAEAALAVQIARNTAGVEQVTSRLEVGVSSIDRAKEKVASTTRETAVSAQAGLDDAWISAKATAVVMSDARFRDTRVDIRTSGGVLTVSGTVGDESIRSAMIDAISQVVGVREVVADALLVD